MPSFIAIPTSVQSTIDVVPSRSQSGAIVVVLVVVLELVLVVLVVGEGGRTTVAIASISSQQLFNPE
jgi:hypothetical protein